MKLIFLTQQLNVAAGTERIATGLMNELAEKGYHTTVVLFGTDQTSVFPLHAQIRVINLGVPFENRYKFKAAFRLRKIVNEIAPDYLINVAVPMMQVSLLAKMQGMHGKLFRICCALTARRMIVLTEQDRNQYPSWVRGKIQVIGNWVMDAKVQSDLQNKTVLSIGRLVPNKGFSILLEVWGQIAKDFEDWTLQIVGSGDEKSNLLLQIKNLKLESRVKLILIIKKPLFMSQQQH